jgi:ribonuclease VapC
MILDSSVLVAIALDEPEREAFVRQINAAAYRGIGAPTLVEAGMVLSSRRGADAGELLGELIAEVDVIEFGARHWREAISAWWRYGEGRHPAGLNFGDCLSYATARVAGQPLLAKGDDFRSTDIKLA